MIEDFLKTDHLTFELNEDSLSEVEMNPVVSMAMEQVKKDIESSSQELGISSSKSNKRILLFFIISATSYF